jgi:hypothetical protein
MKREPMSDAAREQHGALSHAQLRRLGMSTKVRRAMLARGELQRAAPGVVVVAGSPETWLQRLQVGLLALGPTAFVSHEAAAHLLGLDRSRAGRAEFTIPRTTRRVTIPNAVVHTTRVVGPVDVLSVEGMRCASATRTVLDLAAAGAHPAPADQFV